MFIEPTLIQYSINKIFAPSSISHLLCFCSFLHFLDTSGIFPPFPFISPLAALSLSVTSSSPSPFLLSPLSPASFPHPHVDVQAREVTTIKPDPIHRRRADNLTETFFPGIYLPQSDACAAAHIALYTGTHARKKTRAGYYPFSSCSCSNTQDMDGRAPGNFRE